MKNNLSFDKVALGVLLALAILVGVTIFVGETRGVIARTSLTEENEAIGAYQKIKISFSEPVNNELAFDLINVNPIHEGYLQWVDDRTAYYVPLKPFDLNVKYTLTIDSGVITSSGGEIKQAYRGSFSIREPLISFLFTNATQSGVWSVNLNGDELKQLSSEKVKVLSYDAAQTGDFLVYTAINDTGGISIWKISRAGKDDTLLLDCGADRCTVPSISPDAKYVAYSREVAGPTPDIPFGSPRVWLLNLENGANNPVYEDDQVLGYNPSWSPDSKKLASFDGLADRINLLDLGTNHQFIFPSNTGGVTAWSPDSTQMLFTNVLQTENGFRTQVHLADLTIGDKSTLIGNKDEYDFSYYSMAWSSNPERAVLSFRLGEDQPAQVLWLFNPTLLDGIVIAGEENYTYSFPQWDPWATTLVFQQFQLKDVHAPEIGYWQDGFDAPKFLVEGILPQWLP